MELFIGHCVVETEKWPTVFQFQEMKTNFSAMTKGCCCLRFCKNSPQMFPYALETVYVGLLAENVVGIII